MLNTVLSCLSAAPDCPSPVTAHGAHVQSMKAAGLDVRLDVEANLDLDDGSDLAVYRIIHEGLTNVLRHAGRGKVLVRVTRPDDLRIEVIDSCSGSVPTFSSGGGNGIAGMRERVGMCGGELVVGAESNGFAVRARIPMERRQ